MDLKRPLEYRGPEEVLYELIKTSYGPDKVSYGPKKPLFDLIRSYIDLSIQTTLCPIRNMFKQKEFGEFRLKWGSKIIEYLVSTEQEYKDVVFILISYFFCLAVTVPYCSNYHSVAWWVCLCKGGVKNLIFCRNNYNLITKYN